MMKSSSQSSLTARATLPCRAKLDYSRSPIISSSSPIDLIPSSKIWKLEYLFGGCMRAAKKTLQKCLSFLVPSAHPTLRCSRSVSFSKSTSTRGGCKDSARSSGASNATAAAASSSNMQLCRSNADISIYDAIVHCKKSIGQS
ncbi:uncharacterized protein LOC121969649 [Zingiber officinale]|uniref:uncharacterized protein LOC121969649 n=1 Tax=Zingiber officinale TaxID=94328 RepID=UPI001C4D7242|nr:uncharacterized protein LOC121969649 [Zingiber officinale]